MDITGDLLGVLTNLVAIPSVSKNKEHVNRAIDYVESYVSLPGVAVRRITKNGVASLIVTSEASKEKKHFKIMVNAHVDVVPGREDQFSLQKDGNIVTGRGVYDMKGAAASYIVLIKALALEGKFPDDVVFTFVGDEEIGVEDGTGYLVELGILCDFFLVGEPTNLNICYEQKGILWVKLIERGIPAHGSKPWLGKNANIALAKKIAQFYTQYPELEKEEWKTTYTLSLLQGGSAGNIVADKAWAQMDIRHVYDDLPEEILGRLRAIFSEIEIIFQKGCLRTNPTEPIVERLAATIEKKTQHASEFTKETYGSDAQFYSELSIPCINFGPSGRDMHGDYESLDLESLTVYYDIIREFILE